MILEKSSVHNDSPTFAGKAPTLILGQVPQVLLGWRANTTQAEGDFLF
jgi:hypothetical protein